MLVTADEVFTVASDEVCASLAQTWRANIAILQTLFNTALECNDICVEKRSLLQRQTLFEHCALVVLEIRYKSNKNINLTKLSGQACRVTGLKSVF